MWSIGKGILWLLDGFFDIINKIWRFEFFNNSYVDKIFNASIINLEAIRWDEKYYGQENSTFFIQ